MATDTAVIIIFSVFVMGIGMLFARTGTGISSFFAGGEAVPWPIAGLSLFMSFFSAGTFVAWGSIAYAHGWVAVTIQWTMCIGALVTAAFLAPRWKATGNITAAAFIRERLGPNVQQAYIHIFLVVSFFIKGTVLYPVALLVSGSLQLPLIPTTIALGVCMIAYTAVGGLWAVMVTDILQFVILTAAVTVVLPLAWKAAGGWQHALSAAPEGFLHPVNGEYTTGFILAFTLYHVFHIGGNWTFVQRYTSVRSGTDARKVALLFAGLYLVSPVIWMLPPMLYRIIEPSLPPGAAESAYLAVCREVLPPGLLGLMLTGMYFSTSASANTTLNLVSAVITNDIYKARFNPQADDRRLMAVARASSWAVGVGMIGIALLVPHIGGLVNVTLGVGAITGGPLLAPPIWALFSKRLTGKATLQITLACLGVNLLAKTALPALTGTGLSRGEEMLLGVGLPLLLLAAHELLEKNAGRTCSLHASAQALREERRRIRMGMAETEQAAVRRQNRFGLQVTAVALLITGALVAVIGALAPAQAAMTTAVSLCIMAAAAIPWQAAGRIREGMKTETDEEN